MKRKKGIFSVLICLLVITKLVWAQSDVDDLFRRGDYSTVLTLSNQLLGDQVDCKDRVELLGYKFASLYGLGLKTLSLEVYRSMQSCITEADLSFIENEFVLRNLEDLYLDLNRIDSAELFFTKQIECQFIDSASLEFEVGRLFYSSQVLSKKALFGKFDSVRSANTRSSDFKGLMRLNDILLKNFDEEWDLPIYEGLLVEKSEVAHKLYGGRPLLLLKELRTICRVFSNDLRKMRMADSVYNLIKEISDKAVSDGTVELADNLCLLAGLEIEHGNFRECIELCEASVVILEEINMTNSLIYSTCMNWLAVAHKNLGYVEKAVLYSRSSFEFFKQSPLTSSDEMRIIFNNYGLALWRSGDIDGGRNFMEQSLQLYQRELGALGIDYAASLINYGRLLNDLGDYQKANKVILESKNYFLSNDLNTHDLFPFLLLTEGENQKHLDHLPEAITAYEVAIEIEIINGVQYPGFLSSLENSLADALMENGDLVKCLVILERSKKRQMSSGGEFEINMNHLYNSYAEYYLILNNLELAEEYALKSIEILDSLLPKLHYHKLEPLTDLIVIYSRKGQLDLLISTLREFKENLYTRIVNSIEGFNERRALRFVQKEVKSVNRVIREITSASVDLNMVKINLFEIILMLKNMSFKINRVNKYEKYSKGNIDMEMLLANYKFLRAELNRSIYKETNRGFVDSLSREIENIESYFNRALNTNFAVRNMTLNELQSNIDSTEMIFDYYGFNSADKELCALQFCVSHDDIQIQYIHEIDDKFVDFSADFVYKNLREGNERLHFSSSGDLLSQPYFVQKDSSGYLMDFYDVDVISSYLDFRKVNIVDEKSGPVMLIGGLSYSHIDDYDYDYDLEEPIFAYRGFSDVDLPQRVASLPGTLKEVEGIHTIIKDLGYPSNMFVGLTGNKNEILSNIEKLNPQILHIATHGYCNKVPLENYSRIPFSSGLMLSGYNEMENKLLAILTAYDIENLNLSNLDLVVLSACNTGLGAIQNADGIYGLERAFKKAGAKNVIVTLGEVSDDVAQEFFLHFYENLSAGLNIRQGFVEALKALKRAYPEAVWSKFILFGLGNEHLLVSQVDYVSKAFKGIAILGVGLLLLLGYKKSQSKAA